MADPKTTESSDSVLRLIAEQYAMPLDQLARFLGADEASAARLVGELADLGLLKRWTLLVGGPEWIWLTRRGVDRSGTRFGAPRPEAGSLERIRALNEVRLQVASRAPGARWISGRSILRDQGKSGSRPNAVIETEGEQHAIAIRLGYLRARESEEEFIETLLARYDALIVFAAAKRLAAQKRLAEEHDWPRLAIRPFPKRPCSQEVGPKPLRRTSHPHGASIASHSR